MMYSQEPTPEQLLDLSQGAKLSALAEPLTEDIQKLMQQAQTRVYTAISTGQLTPEMAVQAWHEMNAYHRILQRFNQKVKVGQATAEALHKGENK